jgi:CAAX prenyl protease-like protein
MQQRQDRPRIAAYVVPFLFYVIPTMFEPTNWLGLKYEFICTLKGIFAAAGLWWFRREYPPFATSGFKLAMFAGVLGCVVWVALERCQAALPGVQLLTSLVGIKNRVGFDPYSEGRFDRGAIAFVIVRMVELTAIVPTIEEVFWRGFLARYLIADDFQKIPHGTFTPFSFTVVTLAFASAHPEFLSAIAWGMMVNGVYRKTTNLWACVLMHSVTNGLLGIYILRTQSWYLW